MNKKFAGIITTGLLAAGLGIAIQQPKVQASNGYTVVKTSFPGGAGTVYHAKSFSKNAYVWEHLNHYKKIANLKNYPNSSWVSFGTIVLKHNGKKSVYYAVNNFSPDSKKETVSVYVWRGYLKKGYNPNFSKINRITLENASNTDYNNFIQQSPSQKLTRQVLSLFPNSRVNASASLYALFRNTEDKPEGNILAFKDVDDYLNSRNSDSNAQRVAKIKSMLLNQGVDLNKAYTIGIYLNGFNLKKNVDDPQQGLALIEK